MQHVAVLGAGITGITTATVLQESGFSTTVFAPLRADKNTDREHNPEFASIFPAACILPHSVEGDNVLDLFSRSQEVFARLAAFQQSGIRWQHHYELDAAEVVDLPPYTRTLAEFSPFDSARGHLPFDRILGRRLSGWVARILFAEMPTYLTYLFRRYLLSGGQIIPRSIQPGEFRSIPASLIVNCTGIWARSLFGDLTIHPIRGYLTFVRNVPVPPDPTGLFSYNYKPPDDEYPFDVYFFPRRVLDGGNEPGWLLGGTREVGEPGIDGTWRFPATGVEMRDGIPAAITDLNSVLLKRLTGIDIASYERTCCRGFRPGRSGGIRLELSNEDGIPVVHNYGHGGAGVALSWGCALRVLEMVRTL